MCRFFAGKSIFSSIIEKSAVTSDSDVINVLFDALASAQLQPISDHNDVPTVDHEIFAAFYYIWKQVRKVYFFKYER